MAEYVTITSVEELSVSPEGITLQLVLDEEPDDLLRRVVEQWDGGPAGLRSLSVMRKWLTVETDLDEDAPARVVHWLHRGDLPALVQMQDHARELRATEREALFKARQVLERPM